MCVSKFSACNIKLYFQKFLLHILMGGDVFTKYLFSILVYIYSWLYKCHRTSVYDHWIHYFAYISVCLLRSPHIYPCVLCRHKSLDKIALKEVQLHHFLWCHQNHSRKTIPYHEGIIFQKNTKMQHLLARRMFSLLLHLDWTCREKDRTDKAEQTL